MKKLWAPILLKSVNLHTYDDEMGQGNTLAMSDNLPYVIEPIRSTDQKKAQLQAAASRNDPEVHMGTTADGQGFVSPDDGSGTSHATKE